MIIDSEQSMQRFGERFGALLRGGEVIELVGDVGAGKTTFVRGLARGMGIEETVQSPSFTISRVYETDRGIRLAHYDFYRLSDAGIMVDELNEAAHDNQTVVVIEWADTVASVLPGDRTVIKLTSPGESVRELEITASDDMAAKVSGIVV